MTTNTSKYVTSNNIITNKITNIIINNSNHLICYTSNNIYYDSLFALSYIHFNSTHICTHTIHLELKILFHLP